MKRTDAETVEKKEANVKWTSRVAYFIIGIAFIAMAVVGYWLHQGSNVLEIKDQPVPIRTIRPEAHPDGVVILHYNYCKNVQATGRVRTSFVSEATEIFLPATEDTSPAQCADIEVPVLVPPQVVTGTYHLHFRAVYKVNPLKEVVVEWNSKDFEVVK